MLRYLHFPVAGLELLTHPSPLSPNACLQYCPYLRTRSIVRQYWAKLTLGGTEWSLWYM